MEAGVADSDQVPGPRSGSCPDEVALLGALEGVRGSAGMWIARGVGSGAGCRGEDGGCGGQAVVAGASG